MSFTQGSQSEDPCLVLFLPVSYVDPPVYLLLVVHFIEEIRSSPSQTTVLVSPLCSQDNVFSLGPLSQVSGSQVHRNWFGEVKGTRVKSGDFALWSELIGIL